MVAEPGPPPLAFVVVAFAEDYELVPLAERQLIGILGLVVVNSKDTTAVQYPELLLNA